MNNSQRINRKFKNIKEDILIKICVDENMHGRAVRGQTGYDFEGEVGCVHGLHLRQEQVFSLASHLRPQTHNPWKTQIGSCTKNQMQLCSLLCQEISFSVKSISFTNIFFDMLSVFK